MAPLRIEVSGESQMYVPAERAVVNIRIASEGKSQENVSQDVITTSNKLREMLKAMEDKDSNGEPTDSAAITHYSGSAMSTGSWVVRDQEGNSVGRQYNAAISFSIKFQDFSKMGPFSTTLSTMEHVNVTGVDWRLTDKTRRSLRTKSRQQAIHDAIEKGEDIASILGVPTPPIVSIIDASMTGTYVAAMRFGGGGHAMGGDDLTFDPEDVSITCNLTLIMEAKE